MSRVLVTGATGFIGGHLVELLLEQGRAVRCLVRSSSRRQDQLRSLDVDCVECDLRDPVGLDRALTGVGSVFHLSGLTAALRVSELFANNHQATANLVRACARRESPPTIIYTSSIAAAGPVSRDRVRRDADPAAPMSHYGRSKRAAELELRRWAAALPVTIVRPGIVFGPRNRNLLPVFRSIDRIRTHVIPTFSPPPLSLIHVTDLVRWLLHAETAGSRLSGAQRDGPMSRGFYFACRREYPDYARLGKLIGFSIGYPHIVCLPLAQPLPWLVGAGFQLWGSIRGRIDEVNLDKMREAAVGSWACSPDSIERDLCPLNTPSLVKQLHETGVWYRAQGWL